MKIGLIGLICFFGIPLWGERKQCPLFSDKCDIGLKREIEAFLEIQDYLVYCGLCQEEKFQETLFKDAFDRNASCFENSGLLFRASYSLFVENCFILERL